MKVAVYNQKNEKAEEINLSDKVFGAHWNPDLVHQALSAQLANRRQILAHTKDRGEVRGGGRKPWRQKGTGRSRQGSIRSPLWKGGGVTFGPIKEKKLSKKINKKMKKLAVFGVLSRKLKENELKIVDGLKVENAKTKSMAALLKNILKEKESALIIPSSQNKIIKRLSNNIRKIGIISPYSLNVYDLLRYKNIILEKTAAGEIESHYTKSF